MYVIQKTATVTDRSSLQYLKVLISLLQGEEPFFVTVRKCLQRTSAKEPLHQALGISPANMIQLIQIAPRDEDRIVLRLAWMTASRWAEISALTTDCFIEGPDGSLILDWSTLPKRSKINPFQEFRYLRLMNREAIPLRKLIHERGPGMPLTSLNWARLCRLMRSLGPQYDRFGAQRFFSAHSIKRGALQAIALIRKEIPFDARKIVLLGKHHDALHFSHTTIRYLQEYSVFLTQLDTLTALLGGHAGALGQHLPWYCARRKTPFRGHTFTRRHSNHHVALTEAELAYPPSAIGRLAFES
eukprot:gene11144-biopygen8110